MVKTALARLTDLQLALLLAAALFVLGAWPLALVRVPPLQDLPNHLATAAVLAHPHEYPEFVFNGYFKTNSALFAWLSFVGHVAGLETAGRLFVLLVLALGALALPLFVLSFGGRERMVVAAAFAWPLVHNWFVSMGMLDFALGFALSMFLLVLLNRLRQRPGPAAAAGAALLGVLVWYAHVLPLLAVILLVGIHLVAARSWRRPAEVAWLTAPLVLPGALAATSLLAQLGESQGAMTGYVQLGKFVPTWELFYNLWAEWFWAFTWREIATLVPCVLLGLWAISRARDDVPFLGPYAFGVLAALYFFCPYVAGNWFHVNSRFIAFLWLAALARVPRRIPRALTVALCICAVTYTIGMGVDYVRLAADWQRFTQGIAVVPSGARLLPLVFGRKGRSENTRPLLHAWGFYVLERETSAPLLFAHSRSFPLMYREPPPVQYNHLVLESFAPSMASPEWLCATLRSGGVSYDCESAWQRRWLEFWSDAEARFDHVLMWDAPPAVMRLVPRDYRVILKDRELTILARDPASRDGRPPPEGP
jgi:hypothetical protein